MIGELFLNPWVLLVAAALISVPIIIHLINRMRFKRVRWAAMEFLLKAQKRTRRRLIIEQLLLLALRCLLIALVGLLVSRFVGCGDTNTGGKPSLHLVLLDDTLSMQDQVKGPDGTVRSCFEVAKQDFLIMKIVKGLSQSKTNDQLMIVPLSKLEDPEALKKLVFQNLSTTEKKKDAERAINELEPTALHVNMLDGIKLAKKIVGENSLSRVTLHILGDYRFSEWSGKAGEAMHKELLELVRNNQDMKIRPIDTVFPQRGAGYPPSNDNVGIVEIRPSTRVVGHKMLVHFKIFIKNFSGKQVDVELTARNEETGKDMRDVDFDIQGDKKEKTRVRLTPGEITEVSFDYGDLKHGLFFDSSPKPGESKFAHLSVRLVNAQKGPLDNDGLLLDNIRYTVVEVRDRVPVLVVDGKPRDLKEAEGGDTFILERSLASIPGSNYQIDFGSKVGEAAKALEQPDLTKYPTIFLANVPRLNLKQLANLENFVREGGGVAFYMGPQVDTTYYNKFLYKNGTGVFPVPLMKTYYPAPIEPDLKEKDTGDTEQLLIREDQFGGKMDRVPIFQNIFDDPRQRVALLHLPIRRYFKIERGQWKQDPSHEVKELATLPNENPASTFEVRVADITRNGAPWQAIQGERKFEKYLARLTEHVRSIESVARRDAVGDFKAYHLASRIDALLKDRGNSAAVPPVPGLTEFWENSGDPNVQSLKSDLEALRKDVQYGDPFIITQKYGKGNVVAIMSTVGKDWNDWCGGSLASVAFLPFIWEMQNYLSSPGEGANLLVGSNKSLVLDAEQFKGANLKLVRHFVKPMGDDKKAERVKETSDDGVPSDDGKLAFTMKGHSDPGLYEYKLVDRNAEEKPLAIFAHVYNVDTLKEGQLQRVGSEELDRELISKINDITKNKDSGRFVAPGMPDEALVAKQNDFSESPWLFLILLLVLVAEQALAVHLSFHLKSADDALSTGVRV